MINKIKAGIYIALSYFLILGQTIAYAQSTAAILPQGKTQFFDNNGDPLTSGKVFFYIPSTTTAKTTWQDASKSVANTNPVILDVGGRAVIYGDGTYRQIVRDRNNNIIYDAITASAGTGGGTTGTGDGDLVGTIKPWAGLAAPNQYAFAYGQEISRTIYSVLFTAVTLQQTISCSSGSPTATGFSDTSQIARFAVIESLCFAPGTTVLSKTSTTVTFNNNASLSTTDTIRVFLYGNGNGSTTFNLPDLRGYVVAGRTNMGGIVSSNLTSTYFSTGGAFPDATGAKGGGQFQTLINNNLPAYTPAGTVTAGGTISQITPAGSVSTPTITVTNGALQVSADGAVLNLTASGALGQTKTITATSSTPTFTGTPVTPTFTNSGSSFTGTAQGGISVPFSLIQPTQTLNYIIKITPDSNSADASGVTSLGGMTGDIACGSGLLCTGNIISTTQSEGLNDFVLTGTGIGTPATFSRFYADINIANYGGICDGSTNNTPALTAALNALPSAGGTIYFPRGQCNFNTALNYTLPNRAFTVNITAEGPNATNLYFPNATDGLIFTWSNALNFVNISKLSVTTNVVGGIGIGYINSNSALYTGFHLPAFSTISNVNIRGNGSTAYWATAIKVQAMPYVDIGHTMIIGGRPSARAGTGILVSNNLGGGLPIVGNFPIHNGVCTITQICVLVDGNPQGIIIDTQSLIDSDVGLKTQNGPVTNIQINNSNFANDIANVLFATEVIDGQITNNTFYTNTTATAFTSSLNLISMSRGVVSNNIISAANGIPASITAIGFDNTHSLPISVTGNTIAGPFNIGIDYFSASTSNIREIGTIFDGAVTTKRSINASATNIYYDDSGDWTPTLLFNNVAINPAHYSARIGKFEKRQNAYITNMRITLTSIAGISAGNVTISGWPGGGVNSFSSVNCGFYAGMATMNGLSGYIDATGVSSMVTNGATGVAAVTDANFSATSDIICSSSYPSNK